MTQLDGEFYAETYDDSVPDWLGELDFYRDLAEQVRSKGGKILEIACGTGRIAIRLAQQGVNVVGIDLSEKMLAVAQYKCQQLRNILWVQADMRSFALEHKFDLVIIPGHSFQNLNSPQDQVACLEAIRRHLNPTGTFVLHLDHADVSWLGDLLGRKRGVFEEAESFRHPQTGRQVRTSRAWSYERATQTALCQTLWEELDDDGQVVNRVMTDPIRLHSVFRFEIEHLLGRCGYAVDAVYGDFFRNPLSETSSEMIWVARSAQPDA